MSNQTRISDLRTYNVQSPSDTPLIQIIHRSTRSRKPQHWPSTSWVALCSMQCASKWSPIHVVCSPVQVKVGVKDNQTTNTKVTAIMWDMLCWDWVAAQVNPRGSFVRYTGCLPCVSTPWIGMQLVQRLDFSKVLNSNLNHCATVDLDVVRWASLGEVWETSQRQDKLDWVAREWRIQEQSLGFIYNSLYSLAEAACRTGGKRGKSYRLPQAQPGTGKHSRNTGRHRYSTGWHSQRRNEDAASRHSQRGSVRQWVVQERKLKGKE